MKAKAKAKLLRLELDDLDLSPDLLEEIVHERLVRWAKKGGRARAKKLTPARRREIAKLANAARYATQHRGVTRVGKVK